MHTCQEEKWGHIPDSLDQLFSHSVVSFQANGRQFYFFQAVQIQIVERTPIIFNEYLLFYYFFILFYLI